MPNVRLDTVIRFEPETRDILKRVLERVLTNYNRPMLMEPLTGEEVSVVAWAIHQLRRK